MPGQNLSGSTPIPATEALGQSEAFIGFQELISRVAPVDRPVLILGERGTGKELAASRIHFLSQRWEKPFVALNCAALSPGLIESELFGYEKGAFTGAGTRRIGRFEQAANGTLFLDEIGTIPMEVQEKILRVVEYGCFERVGSSAPTHVDVRIVGATNADLQAMASSGTFKQDLLDRLSFEVIYVPPLRCRQEDIPLLASHFAARMTFELGREDIPEFSSAALKTLAAYSWPGNIRELKNVVERAVYKNSGELISRISFDPFVNPYDGGPEKLEARCKHGQIPDQTPGPDKGEKENELSRLIAEISGAGFKEAVAKLEVFLMSRAIESSRFNQKKAAQKLGLTYDQFRGIKRKYAIK